MLVVGPVPLPAVATAIVIIFAKFCQFLALQLEVVCYVGTWGKELLGLIDEIPMISEPQYRDDRAGLSKATKRPIVTGG